MKCEVARTGAGRQFCKARKHRGKDPFARVKVIHDDLIEPQIDSESETIVRRCANPVGVRAFLALLVGARSRMLDEAAGGAEAAVIVNGKRGDAAAIVIRDQNKRAVLVERNVTGSRSARGHLT